MKHAKNIPSLFLAALAVSCGPKDPAPIAEINTEYSVFNGDTIFTRIDYMYLKSSSIAVGDTVKMYGDIKLHDRPLVNPDLSTMKNNSDPELTEKSLKYLAIGSGISAGYRDGGYFNEGIMTSFPNLIARQLGIEKFEQPLFDKSDYNDFGRNLPTERNPGGGPAPKFKRVSNNTGFKGIVNGRLIPREITKNMKEIDNWARPGATMNALNYGVNYSGDPFFARMKLGLVPMLYTYHAQKSDLFTIEFCDDVFMGAANTSSNFFNAGGPNGEHGLYTLLKLFAAEGRKGCIANIPDPSDFPYFKFITMKQLKSGLGKNYMEGISENISKGGFLVRPSKGMDSLASTKIPFGIKVKPNNPFNDLNRTRMSVEDNNVNITAFAKENGYPVVDLKLLYDRIIQGKYFTVDGVRVDPSYPNGNFFSNDGIYPTAFGQAVIANEFIKTLNNFYKVNIPLIKTKAYLDVR